MFQTSSRPTECLIAACLHVFFFSLKGYPLLSRKCMNFPGPNSDLSSTWLAVQNHSNIKRLDQVHNQWVLTFQPGAVKSVQANHLWTTNFFQWMMAVFGLYFKQLKYPSRNNWVVVSSNRHLEKFSCVSSAGLLMLIIIFQWNQITPIFSLVGLYCKWATGKKKLLLSSIRAL